MRNYQYLYIIVLYNMNITEYYKTFDSESFITK